MMMSELTRMIDQVGKDKGIDKEILIQALEQAMETAARKKLGAHHEIEAIYNQETGEIDLYEFKKVVENVTNPATEIILPEARKLDPESSLNDSIGIKLDSAEFGRIAAQTAKQVIIQKVRDAEREIIYREFQERKGEIISGIVRRFERGNVVVDLGRTEAHVPYKEQIPGEQYKPGDRFQGYLLNVEQTMRGPKIILSRACPEYMIALFTNEVPEIEQGIIEIKACAREPGARAKIAVVSKDRDVDPVGACVGMKGARVQNIVQELKGERIDIVPWNEDPSVFVCNALAPAEVSRVLIDQAGHSMEIIVGDDQLSLAIGRKGQNVRLAAQLTGWHLNIINETKLAQRMETALTSLKLIPGMGETMAAALYQHGFDSVHSVAGVEVSVLAQVPGLDKERAEALIEKAKQAIAEGKIAQPETTTSAPSASAAPEAATSAPQDTGSKDEIFQRLKAEIKAVEEAAARAAETEKE
jgi:N utilization substance protein A